MAKDAVESKRPKRGPDEAMREAPAASSAREASDPERPRAT